MNERRKIQRFSLVAPALVALAAAADAGQIRFLTTRDVSSAGAFVRTDAPLDEGCAVRVELALPVMAPARAAGQGSRARVHLKGRVVRVETEGMAIEFSSRYRFVNSGGLYDH